MSSGSVEGELRTTRTHDAIYVVIGLLSAPLTLWGMFGGFWHLPRESFTARDWWLLKLYDLAGWQAVAIVLSILPVWFTFSGLSAIWRLRDGGWAVRIDDRGISFHPSVGPGFVPWAKVVEVRAFRGTFPEIGFVLNFRFWSLWYCITSRVVRLNSRALGLTEHQAHDYIRGFRTAQAVVLLKYPRHRAAPLFACQACTPPASPP